MISLSVDYLPYRKIADKAQEFLLQHNAKNIPIPIEQIIEFKLGLDIIPLPSLQKDFDIEGFTAGNFSAIYVDEFIYKYREYRFRYTLAHEVGHLVLHRHILQEFSINSFEDWLHFTEQVDPNDYDTLEFQGYDFGGLILVPPKDLKTLYNENLPQVMPLIERAQQKGIIRDDYLGYAIDRISRILSPKFEASCDVISRRIGFDSLAECIP